MNFPEYKNLNDKYQVAILIDKPEPQLIAEAVNKLLNDENLYQQLSNNALLAKNELNWQLESKKLLNIYQQIE